MEEKTVKKTKAQRWRLIKNILLCVFGVSFLITGIMFVKIYMNGQKEESSFKALAEAIHNNPVSAVPVNTESSGSESGDGAGSAVDPKYFEPYLALKEQNPDFAGWLNVPNTNIDYPVMYTPEDPEFYLRRGFDKTYFDSGTPFIGEKCDIDSTAFIIYAHHMINGSMFATLDKYMDEAFWKENPQFTFTTPDEIRTYEVFAADKTEIYDASYEGFKYYYSVGDISEFTYGQLALCLRNNSLYKTGIEPEFGEQILILSTCSYHDDDGRFIVAARRIS
jgi:sortase B